MKTQERWQSEIAVQQCVRRVILSLDECTATDTLVYS